MAQGRCALSLFSPAQFDSCSRKCQREPKILWWLQVLTKMNEGGRAEVVFDFGGSAVLQCLAAFLWTVSQCNVNDPDSYFTFIDL